MSEPRRQGSAAAGSVWLLADDPRNPELIFDFPFNEELNEAVKRLPRRWFDWRRKNWRVPADPRLGRAVEEVLGRFPELVPAPEVLAWLTDSGRWKALVTVVSRAGRGAFVLRTISENRAMEGQYPPGSTVKIVSTAALLAAGLSPDEIVECPQFPGGQQRLLEPPRDVPAVLDLAHPLVVQAPGPADRCQMPPIVSLDLPAGAYLAGPLVHRSKGVRALVRVRPDHDHAHRPFAWLNHGRSGSPADNRHARRKPRFYTDRHRDTEPVSRGTP
jgi:hypothetical protein